MHDQAHNTGSAISLVISANPVSDHAALFDLHPGRAGHLYQPGDYTAAADLTRQLILDAQKRKEMALAGRREVEAKGWLSAIHRIRDNQYQRAIKTFRAHKR